MPQVDTCILLHRIATMLTVSHSRTVPKLLKGASKIGLMRS